METKSSRKFLFPGVGVVVLLAFVLGIVAWIVQTSAVPPTATETTVATETAGDQSEADASAAIQQDFLEAVSDAAIAEPDEVSDDLMAIVADNPDLIWDGQPGTSDVLVATWTSWDGYDTMVGKPMTLTREIWVTVAPQVQTFCRDYLSTQSVQANQDDHVDLTLRLEQLLGLPPDNGKTKFVEMWVGPADLFRPSPDPEITDSKAELDFPTSSASAGDDDAAYRTWFNELKSQSYGEGGYPWTRLGYTYDWGNPDTEVGLSEFVIETGSQVTVNTVSATEAYCR